MKNFSTVHIFGFGSTQIIGAESNGTVDSSTLTKLTGLINDIKSKRPSDLVDKDYHVIHIFPDNVKYLAIETEHNSLGTYKVATADLNQTLLEQFLDELVAAIPAE